MEGKIEQADHDLELAFVRAHQTLRLLRRGAVPPLPRFYELFHASASGERPALASRLRALFETGTPPLTEGAERLYAEFIAVPMPATRLHDVSGQLSGTIAEAQAALSTALGSVTDYSSALADASVELGAEMSATDLRDLAGQLQDRTGAMALENEQLRRQLERAQSRIGELHQDLELVRREAMSDPLTGALNRRAFDQRLATAIADAESTGEPLVLLLADIDHFKRFNDRFGHQIGDQVLRLVAGTMGDNVKGRDSVARIGGEEFAILLPQTRLADAVALAGVMRLAIESKALVSRSTGRQLGRVTASFGVALHAPGNTPEQLVADADRGLYAAKGRGRNCVVAIEPALARESA